YNKLCQLKTLRAAWKVVQRSGLASQSEDTRHEVEEFASGVDIKLKSLLADLRSEKFIFGPAKAIAVKKKGKNKKRQIVLAPIRNRIVQRAMLTTIQSLQPIKKILKAGHNFGGIDEGGVPKAIRAAYRASKTNPYFIRSDIKGFFDNVPREAAVRLLTDHFPGDQIFIELFKNAVNVELDNLASLPEEERELFPTDDTGVAQGSALSPLICNVYLSTFDTALNGRGIVCYRYIDDFIIFGPNRRKARAALKSGLKILKELGLEAYDPSTNPDKADEGLASAGFGFLGCDIYSDRIVPNSKSRNRLKEKVDGIFRHSLKFSGYPAKTRPDKISLAETLIRVSNIVRGWGNTYFFCNDDRVFDQLDTEVNEKVNTFVNRYYHRAAKLSANDLRRSLGVRLLSERRRKPEFLREN
ncbi:MAG TPA: reverse transcriptase domain-containing protein, partial [Nitrososphaera sp.]|nr:reverse transcriptase domain-containing protein [Nitrososphaera sp.]